MKKLVNILLACFMVVALAFGAIACDGTGSKPKDPGVYASKINGVFTLTQYVDDGETTVVDLAALVSAKYNEELGRIKAGAFDGNKTVKEIIVPNTVTEIDGGAFRGMTALEKLTIPFVGANVLADAFSNETDEAPNKATNEQRNFAYIFGTSKYDGGAKVTQTYNSSEDSTATYYIPYTLRTIVVAPKEDGYKIPMYAFNGLTQISKVELSAKVKGIGDKAFALSTIQNITCAGTFADITLGTDWDLDTNENLKIYDVSGLVAR